MEREFEKSLCLGSGVPFVFLSLLISVPNAITLIALYRDPLRCFRKAFAVFLAFIAAVDLFVGIVVCTGESMMRFLCAFEEEHIPGDGDIIIILEYIGVNSSILLVTAMSVDRFVSVVYPHFYRQKVKPRKLILFNTFILGFSSIFASLQLTGISMDVYLLIDIHLHTTFPLVTTTLCYFGIFLSLRKRSRVVFQRHALEAINSTLHHIRRLQNATKERKFATTSFLILIILVISLSPYFVAILIDANCDDCRSKKWFLSLRESSVVFLFVNSLANPFLTAYRIHELKQSVKIVLSGRNQHNRCGLGDSQCHGGPTTNRNSDTVRKVIN
ncbi:uncharacterized protein LOC144665110 [Oculina patagonica]